MRAGESTAAGATIFFVLVGSGTERKSEIRMPKETRSSKSESKRVRRHHSGWGNVSSLDIGRVAFNPWLVWQLMDSGFPTGSFAHSSGLEAAWQHGEVRGRDELVSFVQASLDQQGHAGLPFVMAAFDQPERLSELDELCEAFTINHVANRASRAQGRAFLTAVERIFPADDGRSERANSKQCQRLRTSAAAKKTEAPPFAHFAPIFGGCLRRLGISRRTAGKMFFFNQLRSVLTAAVRLNIVGPMEAQVLIRRLSAKAETVLKACERLTTNDIAQTAPLLDLWQGGQDRLYSRLFQS